jgi:hypothetical protein
MSSWFVFKRVWCKIVKKHKKEIMVWFSGDRESENESWALHFATSVSPLPADPVSRRERTSTHWLLVGPWTNLRLSYLFLTDSLFEERSSICRRRRRDSAQRKDHLCPVSHSPSLCPGCLYRTVQPVHVCGFYLWIFFSDRRLAMLTLCRTVIFARPVLGSTPSSTGGSSQ